MNFSENNLLWVKNVKREQGRSWAYTEYNVLGEVFPLNWPRGRANMGKTNALSPNINDLILIFQTVNSFSGSKKGTYLTHIVTPISGEVETDESSSHPYTRDVMLVARAQTPIPKPYYLDFREPNRGWICNFNTIKVLKRYDLALDLRSKQKLFWDLFLDKSPELADVNLSANSLANQEQIEEVLEGKEKYFLGRHKYYERDPAIIRRKKDIALQQNRLKCEVCDFDFASNYGVHGAGFIECHHIVPIAQNGERKTRVEDLALVCPNCHRMLHRKNISNTFYTMAELRQILIESHAEM